MNKVHIDIKKFKAAIFDMDGTMINNMSYHKIAWKEFLKQHNISFTEEEFNKNIVGKKNDQILAYVFGRKLTSKELKDYAEEKEALYRETYKPAIQEINGLSQLLDELRSKHIKLAIATTAPEKNRIFGLEALGLGGLFDVILGDEDVQHGKPDPEIYLRTAEELHVMPSACVAFEDSIAGVESAKSAGMTVIGILSTHTVDELVRADYVVKDFSEVYLQ
jgi:beta-phosphoglucomutase family hydrolase